MADTYGVDWSNHNPNADFDAAWRAGFRFGIFKCSEGTGFRDWVFARHVANARRVGMAVAAYHYQRVASVTLQADLIESMCPKDIPVCIDVEADSGGVDITRHLVAELQRRGFTVPLIYIPRWYWDGHLGRPSLAGLPPIWASDYRGAGANWSDYGGNAVVLRQFTSTPFDQNHYLGTIEQYNALMGAGEADDMYTDADRERDNRTNQIMEAINSGATGWGGRREDAGSVFSNIGDFFVELREIVRWLKQWSENANLGATGNPDDPNSAGSELRDYATYNAELLTILRRLDEGMTTLLGDDPSTPAPSGETYRFSSKEDKTGE